ncbi:hypothetical protein ACIQXD_29465 [Streptomyces uncialis]|uniref:hypothetical protein n=1 Tax=Streptomyces uncialis TaxID=1048205 RepID=UPI00381D4224
MDNAALVAAIRAEFNQPGDAYLAGGPVFVETFGGAVYVVFPDDAYRLKVVASNLEGGGVWVDMALMTSGAGVYEVVSLVVQTGGVADVVAEVGAFARVWVL